MTFLSFQNYFWFIILLKMRFLFFWIYNRIFDSKHLRRYDSSYPEGFLKKYSEVSFHWNILLTKFLYSTTPNSRIHRLHLYRPLNECPSYDIKPTNGEALVKLQLWKIRSTLTLPSLPRSTMAWSGSTW